MDLWSYTTKSLDVKATSTTCIQIPRVPERPQVPTVSLFFGKEDNMHNIKMLRPRMCNILKR